MARPLRLEFDSAIYHEGGTAATRVVQAVHRYGYSQRKVADFLDLHYATVSRVGKQPSIQETRPDPYRALLKD